LQEKFKKYDSNGWGILNFKDFSKFFTEFLLNEAATDIENRKYSNETFPSNDNEFDSDYYNKTAIENEYNLNNNTSNKFRKENPPKNSKGKVANTANNPNLMKKSFLEIQDNKKDNKNNKKAENKNENDKKKNPTATPLPKKSEKNPSTTINNEEKEMKLHKVIPSKDYGKK